MSSARRFGLPETVRMRHDLHFVDQLTRPSGTPIGRLVPIEDLDANPGQPRQEIGDLTELVASIREKGVLEPLLVRPFGGRFQIIAGERRYRAAVEAGLAEVPCVVREGVTDAEVMEIALIENLQRRDLGAFEEADGLKTLAEVHGYTHEKIAEKLGRSRTSVTETLSLTAIPADVRELCRLADISSKSLLLQVVRQSDPRKMVDLVRRLQAEGATRAQARKVAKEGKARSKGRPRNYVFSYQPKEKTFRLSLQFRKADVPKAELVRALQQILDELAAEPA